MNNFIFRFALILVITETLFIVFALGLLVCPCK